MSETVDCGYCGEELLRAGGHRNEPLVRVSDVRDLLDSFIEDREFDDYFGDQADVRRAVEEELETLRQQLEDITEKESGSDE